MTATEMLVDRFRGAMRRTASGVTVLSTDGPHGRAGLTVSTFCSLSMEPPSVMACALQAAIAKAESLGVPQNITIVDDGGNLLAFVRMDGALEVKLAIASGGRLTNLEGGLPIIFDGVCVGAIGVGSGTGQQDIEVARAALAALNAEDPL